MHSHFLENKLFSLLFIWSFSRRRIAWRTLVLLGLTIWYLLQLSNISCFLFKKLNWFLRPFRDFLKTQRNSVIPEINRTMSYITILLIMLTTCMVTKLAFSINQSTVSILRYSFTTSLYLVVWAIFFDSYQARCFPESTGKYTTNYDTFSSMKLRDTAVSV